MGKFYSKSERGFFDDKVNEAIPEDAVAISENEWTDLLKAQAKGKIIAPDANGKPIAETPPAAPYVASDLSPRRFAYLLAYTGLGDVWDAIQADLKTRDRAQFAQLAAQRSALSFSQVKTLAFVAMFRPVAEQVAPDVDLSDDAIKAAWIMAEGANI
jgi:hypothetical protein